MGVAQADAVAKDKTPDALDADDLAGLIPHVVDEAAGALIERGNRAVSEIGDQQRTPECAEARRRDRHPPRRVEFSCVLEVANERAVLVVFDDVAVAFADLLFHPFVSRGIEHGVCHVQMSVERRDVEGVQCSDARRRLEVKGGGHILPLIGEDLDRVVTKIGREQTVAARGGEGGAGGCVDGHGDAAEHAVGRVGKARRLRVVDDERGTRHGGRCVQTPRVDRSVLGHEHELRRTGRASSDGRRGSRGIVARRSRHGELDRLPGDVAGRVVRQTGDGGHSVIGKLRSVERHALQSVLKQRDAVGVADVLDGRAGSRIVDPEVATGARRTDGDAPRIDHVGVHDLRMEAGLVGHENRLHEPVAMVGGRCGTGGSNQTDTHHPQCSHDGQPLCCAAVSVPTRHRDGGVTPAAVVRRYSVLMKRSGPEQQKGSDVSRSFAIALGFRWSS